MALLDSDNKLMQRLGLSDVHELPVEDKKQFLQAQIEAIRQQLWRSRVDAMLNHNLKTETDAERAAVQSKIAEHENDAKRYAEAITLMVKLQSEL